MRDKAKKDINPSALSIRSHDYRNLISRWKSLSRKYNLDVETIAKQASFPIIQISSDTTSDEKVIYLSAGIHGDEVGATEGLFEWARVHLSQFRSLPFVIFAFCITSPTGPFSCFDNSTPCEATILKSSRICPSSSFRLGDEEAMTIESTSFEFAFLDKSLIMNRFMNHFQKLATR